MEINEEFLKKFRGLLFAGYNIDEKKDTPLTGYLKGYVHSDETMMNYISQYLWERHGINPIKNTWVQQVDHYAFEQGMDWDRGFMHLNDTILEEPYELKHKPVYVYEGSAEPLSEYIDNQQENIQLKNGITIKVGDFIQLNDKIDEDYKKTKFYDSSIRNPSWELFYPSEKDFQYVSFYYKGDDRTDPFSFGRVRRLFSNSTEIIESISVQDGIIFLYTNLFKIEILKALEAGEVTLLESENTDVSQILSDFSKLFPEISFLSDDGKPRRMSHIMEELNDWCVAFFSIFKKSWHNFVRTRSGAWIERMQR